MKRLMTQIACTAATLVSLSAVADVFVPYGQWTALPNCGGSTKLSCPDVRNARERDLCTIEFANSYNCSNINLYTKRDYYPKRETVSMHMAQSFYVDSRKVNPSGNFKAFLESNDKNTYEKVDYQFAY